MWPMWLPPVSLLTQLLTPPLPDRQVRRQRSDDLPCLHGDNVYILLKLGTGTGRPVADNDYTTATSA